MGWVLSALRIIERDTAERVGSRSGICRRAWLVDRCPCEGTGLPIERQSQDDLTEAVIVEVFSNDQRLREADQHAFVTFREINIGKWQGDIGCRYSASTAVDDIGGRHSEQCCCSSR